MNTTFNYQFKNKKQGAVNQLLTLIKLGKQDEKRKIKSLS
ncbi:hypothetical protein CSEC_0375 [Criblamydia sequanensis CRIB-18]|uniref:Uncharacterized protein n=1 Tax=Candidatus Criblamydia sequanensis CRIB-18 TaxID=1437425 RepID=A0A090CY21_9BACT|nr:hypothetical protein CSEC_0375 [Criblamydia sequanensis CRIB-18]